MSKIRKALTVAALAGVLAFATAAEGGCQTGSGSRNQETKTVVFEVKGYGKADISWRDEFSIVRRNQSAQLPWTQTVEFPARRTSFTLTARRVGTDTSLISCTVKMSGKLLAASEESGKDAVIRCLGSM